jgi:long-chain acyl-CoA synthetase
VIRGGYNVYPREIEEVFYEHPDVREAAVIGIPHDELGEEVAAAIALKTGADSTPGELRAFVSSASPPTSTPVTSGSSTTSPRGRPARSSSARSHRQPPLPNVEP